MDIPNRSALERALARKLARLLSANAGRLLELMGDPPSMGDVTLEFWDKEGEEMLRVLVPFLEQVYLEQAGALLSGLPIGVDWALVNQAAIDWASQHGFHLVTGLNNTSQNVLQRAIAAYYRDGLTMGELELLIAPSFGPVRAEMIAVTEVTNAASEGEQAIARELALQGIEMTPIWQTNNDELVCPLCGPRHNKPITDGVYPALHPRCRCYVNHILPKVKR